MGDSNPISVKNARELVSEFKRKRGLDNDSEAVRQALEEGTRAHPHVIYLENVVRKLVLVIAALSLTVMGMGYYADIFTAARTLRVGVSGLVAVVFVVAALELAEFYYSRRPPRAD